MRHTTPLRALLAVSPLALFASIATSQQPDAAPTRPANGVTALNPQANLPYGAKDDKPVSRWTPPPSVGRQLTLNDLLTWKQIRTPFLSNDGKWLVYNLGPNEGDAEVVIRGTSADGKEWRFPVGDAVAATRGAPGGGGGGGGPNAGATNALAISGNSRWVAFLIYPSSATPRGRGRPTGGAATTTPVTPTKLGVVNLTDGSKREFENVRSFRFAGDQSDWLAVHHAAPASTGAGSSGGPAAGGGGGGGGAGAGTANPVGTALELVNLAGGIAIPIANVSEFAFSDAADWIAFAVSIPDQLGNSIQLRQLSTGITRSLDAEKAIYRRLTWADSSDALATLRVVSDTQAGATNDEQVTALLWPHAAAAASQTIAIGANTAGLPPGLVLSGDYAIDFSHDAAALFVGLREPRPPRPRTQGTGFTPPSPGGVAPGAGNTGQVAAAPQTDAEVPSLILWHWKDPRTQATQQVQETGDRAFAYLAAYRVASARLIRLTDDKLRTLQRGPRDSWAVGSDVAEYERDAGIKGFAYRDLYAMNLATGERKLIQKKVPGGGGGGGFGGAPVVAFSPDNSKYAYYDTGDWKVYDFAGGSLKTITAGVNGKFWDTEDDHNQVKPGIPGGLLGWSKDGGSVIVRDNWDLWRLPVNGGGAAQNITGNGQRDQIRYQNRLVFDPRDRGGIDLSRPLYVETYAEWTKKEGLAQVDALKGGARLVATEDAKVDYRRARDAGVWLYTRQTVAKFPDWYANDEGLKNERRLTDANPQQKDVAWTPGARLVEYSCENGGSKHQAVLYLPAGYEKGKRYPTLTYIYELLSQEYNVYSQPNATRYSNPSVFTSRGYAFLKPDIVYHVNDPGRSAAWCIVPAVKAAIATGIVDPERVGLQGHSWGGYQTTFVTTQTNIFKTAVAGAPLTDMISMFGSVYWNSGNTDGSIFISSQGRFTGGPNEVPEAYLRNSPQTFAEKLSIPFMILHNDRDGAVDFNQGITYYNHLRQLGKEVILLEYVGENHGLARPANQKDYALRMTEWFDTFLRDQPAPQWLQDGIPRLKMEAHLKERRGMVDPKAEPERPRLIP
jgi:dipeptidyl aminopeptidase/acylaminoacyl peptidase